MEFAMERHCLACGRISARTCPDIVDVWPSGLAGVTARGRHHLIRMRRSRRLRKAVRSMVTAIGISVAASCTIVLLAIADTI